MTGSFVLEAGLGLLQMTFLSPEIGSSQHF